LAAGLRQFSVKARARNFRNVEPVSAPIGFLSNSCQISGHDLDGIGLRLKPPELRMPRVTRRFSFQNFLREQPFAPRRQQSLGVEITRMNCPEAH
jgi:hypothetical protein